VLPDDIHIVGEQVRPCRTCKSVEHFRTRAFNQSLTLRLRVRAKPDRSCGSASISIPACVRMACNPQEVASSAPTCARECGSRRFALTAASMSDCAPPAQHAAGPTAPCQNPGRFRYQSTPPRRLPSGTTKPLELHGSSWVSAKAGLAQAVGRSTTQECLAGRSNRKMPSACAR
jgi:hypothetical protein